MKRNQSTLQCLICLLALTGVFSGCSCTEEQPKDASIALDDPPSLNSEDQSKDQQPASKDQETEVSASLEPANSTETDESAGEPEPVTKSPSPISDSGGDEKKRKLPAWLTGEQSAESHGGKSQTGGGSSEPNGSEVRAARSAVQKARAHLAASRKAGKRDSQKAFREAVAGWQLVAPHTDHDEQARAIADTLEKELRIHGEAANRAASAPDRFKTLAVE
jgi:hypothetical protein